MKELLGETFVAEDTGKTFTIEKEVASDNAASSIPVDGDPMAWWKSNECKFLTEFFGRSFYKLRSALRFFFSFSYDGH